MAILAYITDKNGGEFIVSKADIMAVPEAAFTVDYKDEVFTFKLEPIE